MPIRSIPNDHQKRLAHQIRDFQTFARSRRGAQARDPLQLAREAMNRRRQRRSDDAAPEER